jgi:TatD DNase family protein
MGTRMTGFSMQLIDIGLNLTHDSFDADRDEILDRARQVGVTRMVITGSSVANSVSALALARRHPQLLRSTAGVHPHHASELDAHQLATLRQCCDAPEIAAVGECGLDYFRNFSPHADQERAFHAQLGLAAELGKPVFLHQRDAHATFAAILGEHRARLSGGVVHCFTGTLDEARTYLDMDLHIGITGWICDERRGMHLRDVVSHLPLDRLMLETDAPYLIPRNLVPKPRTRRNEPMYLPQVLATVAACRNESPASVAAATTANALRMFWQVAP